ncbi:MAG: tetratricopeptide repeat protein [Anaerolineales bacterium]|nr:tetratricopeptide repeat protein [Anaerolineales bacterium]
MKLSANFAEALNARGVAYSYLGDIDNGLTDFNMAISINPNFVLS